MTSALFARKTIVAWIGLRSLEPDITNREAAKRLGVHANYLNSTITKAAKEGWLRFEDPLNRLEFQVLPKVVDNLDRFVEEGDKTVTIEVAKGTLFKAYQESRGLSDASQTVLALKIEPASGDIKVVTGQIVGKPRQLED